MNSIGKHSFISMLVLAILALNLTSWNLQARPPKTEDELIADLSSPKAGVVTSALQKIEKEYPTTTKALPAIKKLLTDPRLKVQRKAARVLGSLHANVDETDIKNICTLLKSSDADAVIDGLKALRGLKAQSAIPEILPLLKNSNEHVLRDSCRTLAVLGDKSLIPDIKPLLEYPNAAVQKDASDAIYILKQK
jgi:HEAT repeat protein